MRYLLFIVLLLFISIQNALAQYSIGLKAGSGFSQVNTEPVIEQEYRRAGTTGIVFKHTPQKYVGIQTELNYTQKGWRQISDTTDAYFQHTVNYLELPFMTHVYLGKKTRFVLNIGPQIAYQLSAKTEFKRRDENQFVDSVPRRFQFGLAGGIGMYQSIGRGGLQFELRYSHELTDAIETPDSGVAVWWQNQFLCFSVAYIFPAGNHRTKQRPKPENDVVYFSNRH